MSKAEVVDCPDNDCDNADSNTDGTNDTSVITTKTTFCPFKHTLCVGEDGAVTISVNETQYADGNYNQITLVDGCVGGLSQIAPRGYVAPACCATEEGGSGEPSDLTLAVSSCQLLTTSGGALLAEVHFSATSEYKVTGCGTTANPFSISGPDAVEGALTIDQCNNNSCVTVTGVGTSTQPLKICHVSSGLSAGTYAGFTIDKCGHVIAFDEAGANKIYTSESLSIDQNACTIERTATTTAQTYTFLGGSVSVNEYGDITDVVAPTSVLTTSIPYLKPDNSVGTMTFTNGLLTGQN